MRRVLFLKLAAILGAFAKLQNATISFIITLANDQLDAQILMQLLPSST
jgi:hypothetical protein